MRTRSRLLYTLNHLYFTVPLDFLGVIGFV